MSQGEKKKKLKNVRLFHFKPKAYWAFIYEIYKVRSIDFGQCVVGDTTGLVDI